MAAVLYTVCAIAGREHLLDIFKNFLGLIGYWTIAWIVMMLEEHLIFRRGMDGFDWEDWDCKERLPLGAAALVSFLVGWAGAIVGMYQTYYTGPIAALVGEYGADVSPFFLSTWASQCRGTQANSDIDSSGFHWHCPGQQSCIRR